MQCLSGTPLCRPRAHAAADFLLVLGAAAALTACGIEPHEPHTRTAPPAPPAALTGLRSAIYAAPDLETAKRWYARVLDAEPYFDESFYVGFDVDGYELGLDPDTTQIRPGAGGVTAYWTVRDADSAYSRLLRLGAAPHVPVTDVGGGTRTATVRDPFGNLIGLIDERGHRTGTP